MTPAPSLQKLYCKVESGLHAFLFFEAAPGIPVNKLSISFHREALHKTFLCPWLDANLIFSRGPQVDNPPRKVLFPQKSTEKAKTSVALTWLAGQSQCESEVTFLLMTDKVDTFITKSFFPNPQGFKSFPSKQQFVKKPLKWCAWKLKQAQKDGVTFHHLPGIIIMPTLCKVSNWLCDQSTEILP